MLLFLRTLLTVALISLGSAFAAAPSTGKGNLAPVLNAFIASVAKDHPEFKADIKLWTAGDPVRPGDQVGKSAAMGTYTFRPKVWTELTAAEQQSVLRHPSLKAFIVSMRNARIYPAISAANPEEKQLPGWIPVEGAVDGPREYHASIAPDEMLRTRTTVIPVETRPAK